MKASDLKPGNIINNGFYDIEITSIPTWNGTHERWLVYGYRFVPSRNAWDSKCKLYGFREFKLIENSN